MGIDQIEATRRGRTHVKAKTKHPYAAIEHRVIDSPAYIDLTFSARALLLEIVRQLTKENNGHLQATYSYMKRHGFSENTLSRAIKELIAHGMVYRTRSGGYQQGAAQYAVTWLPIKNKQGIFLDSFQPCAWRDWQPEQPNEKKIPPPKIDEDLPQKGQMDHACTPHICIREPPQDQGQ